MYDLANANRWKEIRNMEPEEIQSTKEFVAYRDMLAERERREREAYLDLKRPEPLE